MLEIAIKIHSIPKRINRIYFSKQKNSKANSPQELKEKKPLHPVSLIFAALHLWLLILPVCDEPSVQFLLP